MVTQNTRNPSSVCTSLAGPDAVEHIDVQLADLTDNKLLIEVKAASLNFPDLLMTYGSYQFRPKLPFVIGMEGAGVVLKAGRNARNINPGDKVIFRGKTGACARFKIAEETDVSLMPAHLDFVDAAAFGVTFQTAYISLAKRGKLRTGEWLLVHGAGGGVGQACVSVGKALGAKVIATASSPEKRSIAKQSGADFVVDYSRGDFSQKIMDITEGQGANLIMDPVGGWVLNESVKCLSWMGRLLTVGFASGDFGNIDLEALLQKSGELIGVRAGEYGRRNPEAGKLAYGELLQLAEEKTLRPYIGAVWSEGDVVAALKSMESRNAIGKQVISIG